MKLLQKIKIDLEKKEKKRKRLNYSKKTSNDISKLLEISSKKMLSLEEKLQKLELQKEQWQDTEAEQNKEIIQLQNQKERLESELQKYEEKLQKLELQKEQWQDTEAEQNKEIIQLQNQKERLESVLPPLS